MHVSCFNELCLVLYLVNEGMLLFLSFYILEKYFSCISPEYSSRRDLVFVGQYFQHGVVIVLINIYNCVPIFPENKVESNT